MRRFGTVWKLRKFNDNQETTTEWGEAEKHTKNRGLNRILKPKEDGESDDQIGEEREESGENKKGKQSRNRGSESMNEAFGRFYKRVNGPTQKLGLQAELKRQSTRQSDTGRIFYGAPSIK